MPLLVRDAFAIEDREPFVPLGRRVRKAQEKVRWHVVIQGACTKFKRTGGPAYEPPTRLDTQIGPFTKASRLRLLSFMNKIEWDLYPKPLFITLTYPDTVLHRDYARRSMDRFLFLRYLEKHVGEKCPSIWRVEWKPRKTGKRIGKLMPHWHLLMPTLTALNENVVREWWRKSIGHDDTYLDVDVRQVEGHLGAVKYLAKYVSKGLSLGILAYRNSGFRFGRHWGITRKALIRLAPITVQRELTEDEIEAVKQFALHTWPNYDMDEPNGYTLLNPKLAKEWKEFLE